MAEIFGAVASGAGLVSLSMQLLESAQKLKAFYNSSRDAPETVRQLCFDLETMSMALRQFEQYRQNDVFGSELLDRCIMACDRSVAKIKIAVEKIDRLLSKARFAGRIYIGFKEPEVKKLLEEMEHAKSSILLAYTSYCQHWDMRQAARHASVLALQNQQLERLQASVDSGKVALIDQMIGFASQAAVNTPRPQSSTRDNARADRTASKLPRRGHLGRTRKFRVSLPRWLIGCVWEFGVQRNEGVWNLQIKPINVRPAHTYVFDFVREGNVMAVRELIKSRELSVHDCEAGSEGPRTLLEIASHHGRLALCKFLLRETSHSDDDAILRSALYESLEYATVGPPTGPLERRALRDRSLLEDVYELYVGGCELEIELGDIGLIDSEYRSDKPLFLTSTAFQVILSNQLVPLMDLPFTQQFAIAIRSFGWPAEAFSTLMNRFNPTEFVSRANEDGKTAFHWVAAHFGEWLRRKNVESIFPASGFDPLQRVEGYERLASDLVFKGADVHALCHYPFEGFPISPDSQRYDPFMVFLAGVQTSLTWYWTLESIYQAVHRWGQMLIKGGCQLSEYVLAENGFLRSVRGADLDHHFQLFGNDFDSVPVKLSLSEEGNLMLEVRNVHTVHVYREAARTMPGAWPKVDIIPGAIIWAPQDLDSRLDYHWVNTRALRIRSAPYQILPSAISNDTHRLQDLLDDTIWHEFQRAQDDIGMIATVLTRDLHAHRQKDQKSSPRRSTSSPPALSKDVEFYRRAINGSIYHSITTPSRWSFGIHKCPLDGRWRMCSSRVDWRDSYLWRRCFQGRCPEAVRSEKPDYSFEGWFLRNEDYAHVAKRYAEKFCPGRIHIAEATLERKTERIRLAMGPKRREDHRMY